MLRRVANVHELEILPVSNRRSTSRFIMAQNLVCILYIYIFCF